MDWQPSPSRLLDRRSTIDGVQRNRDGGTLRPWSQGRHRNIRGKYRDLLELLLRQGWTVERTVGSHMQLRHASRPGTVTVPAGGKLNREDDEIGDAAVPVQASTPCPAAPMPARRKRRW